MISAAQCRAARALLDWNQDRLAQSASVARATIADFERGQRLDLMRQNMVSIVATLEAAGVEFLPGTPDGSGAGVRYRKPALEFSKNIKLFDGGVVISTRYNGADYRAYVGREILDDLGHLSQASDEQRIEVAQGHLGLILRMIELKIGRDGLVDGERILLTHHDFPEGAF